MAFRGFFFFFVWLAKNMRKGAKFHTVMKRLFHSQIITVDNYLKLLFQFTQRELPCHIFNPVGRPLVLPPHTPSFFFFHFHYFRTH